MKFGQEQPKLIRQETIDELTASYYNKFKEKCGESFADIRVALVGYQADTEVPEQVKNILLQLVEDPHGKPDAFFQELYASFSEICSREDHK